MNLYDMLISQKMNNSSGGNGGDSVYYVVPKQYFTTDDSGYASLSVDTSEMSNGDSVIVYITNDNGDIDNVYLSHYIFMKTNYEILVASGLLNNGLDLSIVFGANDTAQIHVINHENENFYIAVYKDPVNFNGEFEA